MNKNLSDGAPYSLGTFIALWNLTQGQTTPDIHFRIASWLEKARSKGLTRLLLQAFRSSGKSTVIGLYAAWLLYRWPDLRILVLAAEMSLARKMVRNVKRIIEKHPLTTELKPDRLDQWGADRFTVNRNKELRDPSMMARGISANITGARADIIICDDVEVPRTCETAEKRTELRERLSETNYILVPGGTQIYIGTPHTWHTIYAHTAKKELGEDAPYLAGYERLTIPVLNPDGSSAWPERFRREDIAQMKQSTGPNKFASQMMLKPVNIAEGYLNPALLQVYEGELTESDELQGLYLCGRRLVSASAWWDPAFGSHRGDHSVLAIVFTDEGGRYYLHRLEYIRLDAGSTDDEATQQCRFVAQCLKDYLAPSVTLEINGIGRFLPGILRREINALRVPCAVQEVSNTRPKDLRIMEAFDAVLAARHLYVNETVRATPFLTEMQEWRPGARRGHDDGLDAVAGALSREPVRLKTGAFFTGRQNWTGGSGSFSAETDFEV